MVLCCHTLKGQGLGGVRKKMVTLKPEAIIVSRKRSIKDVIPEFSFFLNSVSLWLAVLLLWKALSPFRWSR